MTCGSVPAGPNCHAGPLGPSLADACPGSSVFAFMSVLNSLVLSNDAISGVCERVIPVEEPHSKYDFVVVGGGAAGCAVAARLSEVPDWNVLLLEAGPDEPAGAQVPGSVGIFLKTSVGWNYTTTNESHACLSTNGTCNWPQGRNLGGNTAHSAMIYLRGNPADYDRWTELGNKGWSWKDVEPYFIKGEDNGEIERVGRKHHGTGGPISVERFPYVPPMGYKILDAAAQAGYGISEDFNGDKRDGFAIVQRTVRNGVKRSSSRAYLWRIRDRKNLHVSLNSQATRLIVEDGRAVGVEYHKNGKVRQVHANKEVVLSCGVVESPHLLLLSGIGPKEHLESMDIGVVLDVPGVGENLHDHPCASIGFTVEAEPDVFLNNYDVAAQYLLDQTGPLSNSGLDSVIGKLASSKTTKVDPDIEIYVDGYLASCAPGPDDARQSDGKRVVTLLPTYTQPKSRGRITLASKDPFKDPVIWANYLNDPNDVDRMLEAIRLSLALLEMPAMSGYNLTLSDPLLELCSDHEFNSDEFWICFARQFNYALYHQGGTCKMGPSSDPMAVVDNRLRFRGIKQLRVVDNSIMPQVTSVDTQAPAMMIGERGADFIKEDWGRKYNTQTDDYGVED